MKDKAIGILDRRIEQLKQEYENTSSMWQHYNVIEKNMILEQRRCLSTVIMELTMARGMIEKVFDEQQTENQTKTISKEES